MKYFNLTQLTLHPQVLIDKGRTKVEITAFPRSEFTLPEGSTLCPRWLAMNPGVLREIKSKAVATIKVPTPVTNPVEADTKKE